MIIIYLKIISQILELFIEIIAQKIDKKIYIKFQKLVKERGINYLSPIAQN